VSTRRVIHGAAQATPLLWPVALLVGLPEEAPTAGPPQHPADDLPAALDPRWLTADVVGLARAIREGRLPGLLPILADALEEAGCADPVILSHCRAGESEAETSWVVDLLLGEGRSGSA
jgi:hypothetical protein